jgi:hypothetical protein
MVMLSKALNGLRTPEETAEIIGFDRNVDPAVRRNINLADRFGTGVDEQFKMRGTTLPPTYRWSLG